jgi:formate dehydrogenase iron-sulfur subunit
MPKVIYMDLSRCIYCRSCEVACEREHGGRSNMFVQLLDERYAIPLNCRQCENSPCVTVCPTHAIHRENDEIVTIATMQCIGCNLCALACPFGAIWFDKNNKVVRKCDLCIHRLEQNQPPACVATCSSRALLFGELDDFLAQDDHTNAHHLVISRASGKVGTLIALPNGWEQSYRLEKG